MRSCKGTWLCLDLLILFALPAASAAGDEKPLPGAEQRAPAVRQDLYGDPLPPSALACFGTTRMRLNGGLSCMAFSPDGKMLAAGGSLILRNPKDDLESRPALQLWDLTSGKVVQSFEGKSPDKGEWAQVAFSPDGKSIAALQYYGRSVNLWDVASAKLQPLIAVEAEGDWQFLTWAPDGKSLAVAASGVAPVLCDIQTGRQQRLQISAPASALAFSSDGKYLTCACPAIEVQKKTIPAQVVRWSIAAGKIVHRFDISEDDITLSRDGSKVFAAGNVYDVATGKVQCRVVKDNASYLFSPDGKLLATGTLDEQDKNGRIVLWDTTTGAQVRSFTASVGAASRVVAFSPDGKVLASVLATWPSWGMVRLWDVTRGTDITPGLGHRGSVTCAVYSPDGKLIASGSTDRTVRLWEAETGKPLHVLSDHQGEITALAFMPDGKRLATAGADRRIFTWDTKTGHRQDEYTVNSPALALTFAADRETLVATAREGAIYSWPGGKRRVRDLEVRALFEFACFTPGKPLMIALEKKGWSTKYAPRVRLIDGKALPVELKFPMPKLPRGAISRVTWWSAALSQDGKYVATGNTFSSLVVPGPIRSGDTVRIWDTATGKEVSTFRTANGALGLAFSPNGRFLASAHGLVTGNAYSFRFEGVLLFELPSGETPRVFRGHSAKVRCVAFAPDGRSFVSGGDDEVLFTWKVGR